MWESQPVMPQEEQGQPQQETEDVDEEEDDDFGDDFDDFAEGDGDEDFGDFDEAEDEPAPAPSQPQPPPSQFPATPDILKGLVSRIPTTLHKRTSILSIIIVSEEPLADTQTYSLPSTSPPAPPPTKSRKQ